ncbi:MAG: ribbon-helix-helix protein, CopG family [Candidatus Aminicenantes bacterium]|jgi:metal-responsive CopG/Arc/MetJ family transcriptional regulator|nr:ribbon-helix-helix protein, CopG family [Candidatus Aminicenantes bacterium]
MRTVISVSFPEEMAVELDKLAKESGRTRSEIVKEALRAFLWEERFRTFRTTIRPKVKKRGFVTDEDVFKDIS